MQSESTGPLSQHKEAHVVARIVAKALDRIDDVTNALGHLALVDEPVALHTMHAGTQMYALITLTRTSV